MTGHAVSDSTGSILGKDDPGYDTRTAHSWIRLGGSSPWLDIDCPWKNRRHTLGLCRQVHHAPSRFRQRLEELAAVLVTADFVPPVSRDWLLKTLLLPLEGDYGLGMSAARAAFQGRAIYSHARRTINNLKFPSGRTADIVWKSKYLFLLSH